MSELICCSDIEKLSKAVWPIQDQCPSHPISAIGFPLRSSPMPCGLTLPTDLSHFKLEFSGAINIAQGRRMVKNSRCSEEQIMGILKQSEAGAKTGELCRHTASARRPCTPGVASTAEWNKRGQASEATGRGKRQVETDRSRASARHHDVEGSGWKKCMVRPPLSRGMFMRISLLKCIRPFSGAKSWPL
jgi:hypothetical protein